MEGLVQEYKNKLHHFSSVEERCRHDYESENGMVENCNDLITIKLKVGELKLKNCTSLIFIIYSHLLHFWEIPWALRYEIYLSEVNNTTSNDHNKSCP